MLVMCEVLRVLGVDYKIVDAEGTIYKDGKC